MDIAELKKLVKLMNENDLVELEIQEQGATVRLKKAGPAASAPGPAAPLLPAGAPAAAPPAGAAVPGGTAPAGPAGPPANTQEIRSPIVGTFYRSGSPEAHPYV